MLEQNRDFKLLVIIMLIGIGISIIFHIFLREADAGFSELYFSEPDALPQKVVAGKEYPFSFVIGNQGEKGGTYFYDARVELYNLYDETEGVYHCAARQRKQVSLKLEEGNISDQSIYLLGTTKDSSEFLYSVSGDYGYFDWPYYTARFAVSNFLDGGSFTLAFHNETDVLYALTLDSAHDEAVLFYRSGQSLLFERKTIEALPTRGDIKIFANQTLSIEYDNKVLFNVSVPAHRGKFDFRMDDTFVSVGNVVAFRDSPTEVRNAELIREYRIDSNLLYEKVREFERATEQSRFLIPTPINESACMDSSCDPLGLFLNKPQNRQTYKIDFDINETGLLSLLNTSSETNFPTQIYTDNGTVSDLDWEDFTLKVVFQTFLTDHSLLIRLDDEFHMLFHNQNVFFIMRDNGTTTIVRRPSPVKVGVYELGFESKDNNVVISVNNMPLYNIHRDVIFNEIAAYTKNTFIVFGRIESVNKDESCKTLSRSLECRRTYTVESARSIQPPRRVEVVADPIKLGAALAASPFIGISKLFDSAQEYSSLSTQDISEMLDSDIEIDLRNVDSEIPSQKYVFDGTNAYITDKSNYSFSFDFQLLEGLGLIETSFYDSEHRELVSIVLNDQYDTAHLFVNTETGLRKEEVPINISAPLMRNLDIIYENGETAFYIDHQPIMQTRAADLSNGFYEVTVYNTYMQIPSISLYDRTTGVRIPFTINEDPCRLRKIDEVPIEKSSLYLEAKETVSLQKSFAMPTEFDYGMVSVAYKNVETSSLNEIHFWVVNDG